MENPLSKTKWNVTVDSAIDSAISNEVEETWREDIKIGNFLVFFSHIVKS